MSSSSNSNLIRITNQTLYYKKFAQLELTIEKLAKKANVSVRSIRRALTTGVSRSMLPRIAFALELEPSDLTAKDGTPARKKKKAKQPQRHRANADWTGDFTLHLSRVDLSPPKKDITYEDKLRVNIRAGRTKAKITAVFFSEGYQEWITLPIFARVLAENDFVFIFRREEDGYRQRFGAGIGNWNGSDKFTAELYASDPYYNNTNIPISIVLRRSPNTKEA